MDITVQGKQVDVGNALKTRVEDKLHEIDQKYFNHTTDATVTFSKEGHGHTLFKANISIRVGKNIMVVAEAADADPYAAFDIAAERAAKRMRRYKKKLRDHHNRTEKTPESEILKARDYVLAAQPEIADNDDVEDLPQGDDPVIIAEMSVDVQTLSVSEAVMRMDLADQEVFLFKNASNDQINIVYRRPDGNVGWIDPGSLTIKAAAKKTA